MKHKKVLMKAAHVAVLASVAALIRIPGYGQGSLLRITAPSDGTIITPGQTVTVTLAVDPSVKNVIVGGEAPMGFGKETGVAGQYNLAIPSDTTPGIYRIGASGAGPSGEIGDNINIDVERSDDPQELQADEYVELRKVNEQIPLTVLGIYADGSRISLQRSTKVSYSSANPGIATASSSGVITAVAQGETTVSVSTAGGTVQASVPVRVLLAKATAEDAVPPTTQATEVPPANSAGWSNQNVTVSFSATDNDGGTGARMILANVTDSFSGAVVLRGSTGNLPVTFEGLTTIRYFSVDNTGNREDPHTLVVKLDKTPPVFGGIPQTCALSGSHDPLVQAATISASDANSGLATFSVSATSNQPQDPDNPDIVISGTGLQPRSIQLRAKEGAVYTVTANATDVAGNTASTSFTCTAVED